MILSMYIVYYVYNTYYTIDVVYNVYNTNMLYLAIYLQR